MLTDDELRQIMPNTPASKRTAYLPFIQQAMQEFAITSYLREAAFIAQLAHESGELRYMEEIASGAAYEGRRDLGNTQPGDGRRFKGRGPIQLTGRANYKKYGDLLGVDLIDDPPLAATPEVGFRIAALFWKLNGLNELADQQNFEKITRRINGGLNGYADRCKYYERAKKVLNKNDGASVPSSTSASTSSAQPAPVSSSAPQSPPYPGRLLRRGCHGDDVRSLQERLNALGCGLAVDGDFGPGTYAAVIDMQRKRSVYADGIVGPHTWAALWQS